MDRFANFAYTSDKKTPPLHTQTKVYNFSAFTGDCGYKLRGLSVYPEELC